MTNAVPCLDPETIAAYLDRRLDPAERARVEEHLADCEECRSLLSETALFLEADAAAKPAPVALRPRAARRTWVWSMAAAAAALLALTPLVLRQMRPTPESALAELDRALGGKRYIESRLSAFEYGSLVSATRGPEDSKFPSSVLAAAKRIEELTANSDTPANLAALGAAHLALGRVEQAVENLEDAARIEPENARIQSDLAAAYLARVRAGDDPEDPARAVEAAATAVKLDPKSHAAMFNRALALEALPLRAEALRASGGVPRTGFLIGLGARSPRSHRGPQAAIAAAAAVPLRETRRARVGRLTGLGSAILASDIAKAQEALDQARSLADEIERLDGDHLALDSIAAIDAASPVRLNAACPRSRARR